MDGENALSLSETIDERLSKLDKRLGDFDSRTQAQLEKIERAIQSETALRRAAEAEAKRHDINVVAIATASGISRATFYNKPVLKEYVEEARQAEGFDSDKTELDALKERLREAEETIGKLKKRDGELVVMMAENDRLRKRVEGLESFIEKMPTDIRHDFEAMGIVIPFPSGGTN